MFVLKSTHDEALREVSEAEKKVRQLSNELHRYEEMYTDSLEEFAKAEASYQDTIYTLREQLQKHEETFSDQNSVTLQVNDDLTSVTPYVRVKEEVFEKMVELHYLNDAVNPETKAMAMQLALLTIANESLDQIIESFTSPVEKVE